MLKTLGLIALAAIATLVLGFAVRTGATTIRAGPQIDQFGIVTDGVASITTADVAAVIDNGLVAPLTNIGEISSTTTAGMEDGLGTSFDNVAALPLTFYIALAVGAAIAVTVIGRLSFYNSDSVRAEDVKKARRRNGRVALNSLLRPLGFVSSAVGILLFALAGLASNSATTLAGNGSYLGQSDTDGFPMWTLIALALGSMTLVAGGIVTRRAGK